MKNKNILILGSTGFIGRSLTKKDMVSFNLEKKRIDQLADVSRTNN